MLKVVIIGAAGYVGSNLVKRLIDGNYQITAITNSNGKILLYDAKISIELPENYKKLGKFDIIINLAYPKRSSPVQDRKRNNQIAEMMKHFAQSDTRIVHISTQAVFGYELEVPAIPYKVKNRLDFAYITSKIYLENLLIDIFKKQEFHIVRLGNVWGPASALWTANLINRILFGDVVGIQGKDGYSNTTDIENICSYIGHLITNKYENKIYFHHLAEFNHIKWSHWINLISKKIDIEPVYINYNVKQRIKIMKEILNAFSVWNPLIIAKQLSRNQYFGSFTRMILSKFPQNLVENLERKSIKTTFNPYYYEMGITETFLKLMSVPIQFKNHTDKNWKPVVSPEESWQKINTWMESVGYLI